MSFPAPFISISFCRGSRARRRPRARRCAALLPPHSCRVHSPNKPGRRVRCRSPRCSSRFRFPTCRVPFGRRLGFPHSPHLLLDQFRQVDGGHLPFHARHLDGVFHIHHAERTGRHDHIGPGLGGHLHSLHTRSE